MIQTENGPEKLTYEQFKHLKKRREITHPLVTDDDARIVYGAADAALSKAKARGAGPEEIEKLTAERDQAEKALRDATLLMRLRAMPREGENSYAALKAEHPPRDEDHKKAREYAGNDKARAVWHTKTFAPALVAACLVEPEVTVEQAAEMSRDLNEAEWDGLFAAAIGVNQAQTDTAGLVFS